MLDVTILKVYHATEKEAKKLRPYIEQCDVFSPENGFATEEESSRIEEEWCQLLKNKNRSQVKKWSEASIEKYSHRAYMSKLFDSLYLSRCPIWQLERFSTDEQKILLQLNESKRLKDLEAAYDLNEGRMSSFIPNLWAALRLQYEIKDSRDQHMGANLAYAETRIRQKYSLQDEPLHYSIMIGSIHNIERYTSLPIKCINLTAYNEVYGKINGLFASMLHSFASFDEARPLLLAYGVKLVASAKKIHITDQQILAMDEPTLEKTLREMIE